MIHRKSRFLILSRLLFGLVLSAGTAFAQGLQENDATLWPEPERSFFQDGPGLLLTPEQRTDLRSLNPEARVRWIQEFLDRDPIPETPANELREGIERRLRLAVQEFTSPSDIRAQILFLNGPPKEREIIDCGQVFKPMEIWRYPGGIGPDGKPVDRPLVVYLPNKGEAWRLWVPSDAKRAMYTSQMEYWLQQWEELRGKIRAVRFDKQNCKEAEKVDVATGVPGLTGALPGGGARVKPRDASSFLAPPKDLARWARAAAATELAQAAPELKVSSLDLRFPEKDEQRIVTRALLEIGPDAGLQVADEKKREVGLIVEGIVEQEGRPFEQFRMRFHLPEPKEGAPAILAVDRSLRPRQTFVLRLRVMDETSGAQASLSRAFRVPAEPKPEPMPVGVAGGELLPETVAKGPDTLLLIPPPADVVIGLWRAETIVTGERIKKVVFLVDGKAQLTRSSPPYTAEVRLERYPTEQVVRVEGYDDKGELVASDEVIVNLQRGALAVRVVAPGKGTRTNGPTLAKAEVVIPDGRRIQSVEFKVNDQTVHTLVKPPWEATVAPPANVDLVYLTVVATLDDGSKAEAVRYLKAPDYVEEVEVNLVELYVAVTDRSGDLVRDLKQEDFEVLEGTKPQEIAKFELVQNLPLNIGVLLDTSGSMASSLVETQKAASEFLESVLTPRDRSFAVSFARRPRLEMPPTDDVGAVVRALSDLQAVGDTALHDALVHSLYYFRGMTGQRALVLLSDGDDNASYIPFKDALEYARMSGVAIYVIGLNIGAFETGLRTKLADLAQATGGRSFWADKPEELAPIYKQIETELRSRYLVAYNSTETGGKGGFREVEVKVKKPGLKARTARGYYP
ncbi:MAG TPA: VWA domain-containing protein [Thermoanaerobaculia bacterium]|nr:VWA domain-containing protein [Thermoanaerobaculia bacterium]